MPHRQKDSWNRDDEQKPGSPPHPSTAPAGGGGAKTEKTATDPATGEPKAGAPEPNQAASEQS